MSEERTKRIEVKALKLAKIIAHHADGQMFNKAIERLVIDELSLAEQEIDRLKNDLRLITFWKAEADAKDKEIEGLKRRSEIKGKKIDIA